MQRELAGLSERYSHKCLELNRAEQNNAEREREISRKERDLEQLKKENQVSYKQISDLFSLKSKLKKVLLHVGLAGVILKYIYFNTTLQTINVLY